MKKVAEMNQQEVSQVCGGNFVDGAINAMKFVDAIRSASSMFTKAVSCVPTKTRFLCCYFDLKDGLCAPSVDSKAAAASLPTNATNTTHINETYINRTHTNQTVTASEVKTEL